MLCPTQLQRGTGNYVFVCAMPVTTCPRYADVMGTTTRSRKGVKSITTKWSPRSPQWELGSYLMEFIGRVYGQSRRSEMGTLRLSVREERNFAQNGHIFGRISRGYIAPPPSPPPQVL